MQSLLTPGDAAALLAPRFFPRQKYVEQRHQKDGEASRRDHPTDHAQPGSPGHEATPCESGDKTGTRTS